MARHHHPVCKGELSLAPRGATGASLAPHLVLTLAPRACAQEFVTEFFDQNPISQLAILVTRDGSAERLSALSGQFLPATPPARSQHADRGLPHRQPGRPHARAQQQEEAGAARRAESAKHAGHGKGGTVVSSMLRRVWTDCVDGSLTEPMHHAGTSRHMAHARLSSCWAL